MKKQLILLEAIKKTAEEKNREAKLKQLEKHGLDEDFEYQSLREAKDIGLIIW